MDFSQILQDLWDKLYGWVESMVLLLPNMVVAAMIVALFAIIARYSGDMVGRLAQRVSHNRALSRLTVTIYKIALITVGVFIALGVLQLEKTVTSLLAGAGIIGLALGFAFQDISANFISGVYMALKRPIKPGDLIKTNDYFGTVQQISLRTLHLKTPQGQEIIIPNRQIMQNPLEQY
ncbi:MAG: mechanosensitive ion channel domain-containing protein, partial [Bacteroidota bacterium]